MGRKGHSHSLRNFQSILLSLTIIPRIIPNLLPAPGTQTVLASSAETAVTHQHEQIHVSTPRSLFSPFLCQGSFIPSTQGDTHAALAQALLTEMCQSDWILSQLQHHSSAPAQPSAAVAQPLHWTWLGKTQEELPLQGQWCLRRVLMNALHFPFRSRALPEHLAVINRAKMKGCSEQVKPG